MQKPEKYLKSFIEMCLSAKDERMLMDLLDLFFTIEEKKDLAMRYLIIKELLLEEKTQREIAKDLGVSIAKITRGSNELKRTNSKLLNYLRGKMLG